MPNYTERVRTTQFRQQEMVQSDPQMAISTGWGSIDKTNWDVIESGTGSVDPGTGGLYELSVGDSDGDMAVLRTVDRTDYIPSLAVLFGWGFIADQHLSEDQRLRMGVTTRPAWQDCYRWEIQGAAGDGASDHYLEIIKGGQRNVRRHWDVWASDPRTVGWDETVGAIVRNELGWYDFGEWKPEIQIPDLKDPDSNSIIDLVETPNPRVRKLTLPLEQISPVAETATDNVNFRLRFELENIGPNASSNTVNIGNVHYNVLGQNDRATRIKNVERNGGIGGGNIDQNQPYPLIAIRITEDDVTMAINQINARAGTDGAVVSSYLMRKGQVTFVNGPDTDFSPPPGLDTREAFFEDATWDVIDSVARFDAAGTGNNDPHVGTEGYPVGRKVSGASIAGGSGVQAVGESTSLESNAMLSDLDYLLIFGQAQDTNGTSLDGLDYEMDVDR